MGLYKDITDELGITDLGGGSYEYNPAGPVQQNPRASITRAPAPQAAPRRLRDLPTRDQARMDNYNKRYDYRAGLTDEQQRTLMSPIFNNSMENPHHQFARDAQVRQLAQQRKYGGGIRADVTPQQFSASTGMTERSIPRNARAAAEHRYGPWNEGKTWGRVGKPYAAPQQTITLGGREVPITKPSPNAMVHYIPGTQQNRGAVAAERREQAAMQRRNYATFRENLNSMKRK